MRWIEKLHFFGGTVNEEQIFLYFDGVVVWGFVLGFGFVLVFFKPFLVYQALGYQPDKCTVND